MTDPAAPDLAIVELKPCPFCAASLIEEAENPLQYRHWRHPRNGCLMRDTGIVDDEAGAEAIAAWNTRADSPEAAQCIEMLVEALEKIASGSKLGTAMFEARVKARKSGLTWWAANIPQDHLEACEGTANAALAKVRGR